MFFVITPISMQKTLILLKCNIFIRNGNHRNCTALKIFDLINSLLSSADQLIVLSKLKRYIYIKEPLICYSESTV